MKQEIVSSDTKKAIIYLRVSTEEQVDNFSLETQENICRTEAEKRGFEIVETFREEGRSAKNIIGRPVLISLLEYCRKNKKLIKALLVYRLDRISRVTGDYLAIRKKLSENGVSIISATEPTGDGPTEKLVETILAGFAQLDNDIRSERAKNGMRARFLSGMVVNGRVPLGYSLGGGQTVKDPESWNSMQKAWDLMATGTKSISEMTKIMNDWGLKENFNKRKYAIRPNRVQVLFRNKFYMGILCSKTYSDEVKGRHIPMITEDLFYKVQAIIDGRNPNKVALARRNHENPAFPLRRIIKCAGCGKGLTGAWTKGHGGRYAYYWCSTRCNRKCIAVKKLEGSLVNLLKEITPKDECLNMFIHYIYNFYQERYTTLQKMKNNANSEIDQLKNLRKTLVEKNMSGIYSDEVFKEQNTILEEKIVRAHISKEESIIDKYSIEEVTSFIKTMLADLGESYRRSNLSQVKVMLGLIFPAGLFWDPNGTLNHQISPIYQAIRSLDAKGALQSGVDRIRTCGLVDVDDTL